MNFLAHLVLAGDDEDLRLGAMLGDFIRGRQVLADFSQGVGLGIMLHRHIDGFTDSLPDIARLRSWFSPPFRRYGGIVIDLAFDHQLAMRWESYSEITLEQFDLDVRELLARNDTLVPSGLRQFMQYADRRGLFATYRDETEILHSLRGIGHRLSRPNPLHRVQEVWGEFEPLISAAFEQAFGQVQSDVADWVKSKSTMTGS